MSLRLQLAEKTVPLSWVVLNAGLLSLGQVVKVTVFNAVDGSVLLASTTMTANATTGVATYVWTHGRTVKTHCIAFYSVTGLASANGNEKFTIDTEEQNIETDLGDAV